MTPGRNGIFRRITPLVAIAAWNLRQTIKNDRCPSFVNTTMWKPAHAVEKFQSK
jgi:hypothetical protein